VGFSRDLDQAANEFIRIHYYYYSFSMRTHEAIVLLGIGLYFIVGPTVESKHESGVMRIKHGKNEVIRARFMFWIFRLSI
jgi:TRAP-type mannitol/chloroaromatic compound transport system permease small subunit